MFDNLSINKKANKNPSAGPTTDGFKSRNKSEGIPDKSLSSQHNVKKDVSQTRKAGRSEKPAATPLKKKQVSPAVAFGQQMLDRINTASGAELDDRVFRILGAVRQHLAVMFLISGACAYKLAKNIKIATGAGNEDKEKKGKLEVYKRVGGELDRSARTVEDDKRIYQYCIAEPVGKIADKRQRKMREKALLAQAVQLPRAFLLKAASVLNSDKVLETALRKRQEPGHKSYTFKQFTADIKDLTRRSKSGKHTDDENAASPPENSDDCLFIERSFKLTKLSKTCLEIIRERTKFSEDDAINQVLIYCCEHLEDFAVSPEVLSAQ